MLAPTRYVVARAAALAVMAIALAPPAHAQEAGGACEGAASVSVLTSPLAPWSGAALRVIAASDSPSKGQLTLIAPDGSVAAKSEVRRGGPPYFWFAEIEGPAAGTWALKLSRTDAPDGCRELTQEIVVKGKKPAQARAASSKTVWPVIDAWNRANENLYSAWIEKLFDAPVEETLSWPALHEVLRDPARNALHNHLGLGEDGKSLVLKPDCADLPYFLRAYFAFKMGLPFGFAKCTRGGGGRAPTCTGFAGIATDAAFAAPAQSKPKPATSGGFFGVFDAPAAPPPKAIARPQGLVASFGTYARSVVANGVHSGSGRTAHDDDATDYYPVPLSEASLRPGTLYADPYGHLLVLVKRVAQSEGGAGVFLAVDGQPDGTIARKRFWRGNFLFADDPALGGPGFKRFRPVVVAKGGAMRRLSNDEIAASADYGDVSLDQSKMKVEEFYDRMDDVMSPAPLDPERALLEAVTSLEEQVKARVTSVENGRKYQVGGGAEAAMPEGASIFETTGAWEDFATPSRDLRLLIAIDVVRGFPDRVARRPERYAMPGGKTAADVKSNLDALLAKELADRKFAYLRSDGSEWTLTLKDVIDRAGALEMAYNVNDCVELRWGAPDKSEEASTCKRRAPGGQRAKMSEYRSWFSERRRPPRG